MMSLSTTKLAEKPKCCGCVRSSFMSCVYVETPIEELGLKSV